MSEGFSFDKYINMLPSGKCTVMKVGTLIPASYIKPTLHGY